MHKPEPLRLADFLEDQYDPSHNLEEAADELRRLHAENQLLRTQHLEAHQNSAAMSAVLTEISALTHLGGEVAEYGDVVDAVRRLKSANLKLAGAIDMIRETLNGGNVDDLLHIINTALDEHRETL